MVGRQESFSGNILLYDYLSAKRAPVLLDRNLTRALRVHRHLQEGTSSQTLTGRDHDFRPLWKPPTRSALDEMVEHENSKGSFILQVHGIKSAKGTTAEHESEEAEPARKARVLLRAKSTMNVSVYTPPSDLPCISMPVQDATIQSTARHAERTVSVETDPITIDPRQFGLNDPRARANDAYKLNISLNIDKQNDAEELYSHLAPKYVSSRDVSTRLSTTWSNILKCPSGKVILPLSDWKGCLKFGLEVTMYWICATGESILTRHNKRLRALVQPQLSPKPPLPHNTAHSTAKLTFMYVNEVITRDGLVCPHEGCQQRKPTDIDDLRMHLDSWHDYFKYKATREGIDDDGTELWTFKCEVSDHKAHRAEQRASARAPEPMDVRLVIPAKPFNQRRYLDEGDDEFRRISRGNKQYGVSRAAVSVPTDTLALPRRKLPDEVADRPVHQKKRYLVPAAPPGVTFFRSHSKRPLRTGECISESDDDVDDTWIKLRKSAEFDKEKNILDPVKRFLKEFDLHMWGEQLHSDVHAGDALVRFVREKRAWLWQEGLTEVFKDKLGELFQDGIITEQVHDGCWNLVQNAKPDSAEADNDITQGLALLEVRRGSHDSLYDDPRPVRNTALSEPARSRSRTGSKKKTIDKGKGKAKVTETGHLTPITADSDGDLEMREATLSTEIGFRPDGRNTTSVPPYDRCLCGDDAQASYRTSPMIACSSMVSFANPSCDPPRLTTPDLHTKEFPLRLYQRPLANHSRRSHTTENSLDVRRLQTSFGDRELGVFCYRKRTCYKAAPSTLQPQYLNHIPRIYTTVIVTKRGVFLAC
jgi:hypothetical protein